MKLAASLLLSVDAQWWNVGGIADAIGLAPATTSTTTVSDNTPTVPTDAPGTGSTPNNSGTIGMPSDAPATNSTPNNSGTSGMPSDAPATNSTPNNSGTDAWTDNWNG